MAQIKKKFIENDAVDETKIRLSNTGKLNARNAADSADIDILSVNASDRIVFDSVPQVASGPSAGNDLTNKTYVDAAIAAQASQYYRDPVVGLNTSTIADAASIVGESSTFDGITVADGTTKRVLFTGISAGGDNKRVYLVTAASGLFSAATLELDGQAGDGSPTDGDTLWVQSGTAAGDTQRTYNGTNFVQTSSGTTLTGGDMVTISGSAVSVDLHTTSGLESSNAGNAAGQLRVKVEASNPTIQIDGSNQLGVKLDGAGAIITGSSGVKIQLESSNPTLSIGTNKLGVKLDTAGAIITGASGIKVQADGVTAKINGSNQVETLKDSSETFTLNGTDITNQYLDLAHAAYGTSASVNSVTLSVSGAPTQTKTVDYTISLTGGAAGVTRVTFAGDLATAGNSELVATDIVQISYSFLT